MKAKNKKTQVADLSDFFDTNATSTYNENNEDSLISYLRECDKQYYREGQEPLLPDSEYDRLRDLAQNKWPDNEYFSLDNIGSEVTGSKVQHEFVLGSLTKYKVETINDWLKDLDPEGTIFVLPKYDGLSVYVEVKKGKLVHAATRGNGTEGTDITEKMKHVPVIKYLKEITKLPEHLKLRGEIILPGDNYKEFGFANRRNGASGLAGKKDIIPEELEKLEIIFYEVISPELTLTQANNVLGKINHRNHYITGLFKVQTLANYPGMLPEHLADTKSNLAKLCDIDGLVLIYDGIQDEYVRENIYRPKNKVAFKGVNESAVAAVDFVEWNTSRSGRIVPIVNFMEPYPILDGANIRKATGYNAKFIVENKIQSGVKVEIVRSGEIIPKIVRVIQ